MTWLSFLKEELAYWKGGNTVGKAEPPTPKQQKSWLARVLANAIKEAKKQGK
jgi:hypothetical protein